MSCSILLRSSKIFGRCQGLNVFTLSSSPYNIRLSNLQLRLPLVPQKCFSSQAKTSTKTTSDDSTVDDSSKSSEETVYVADFNIPRPKPRQFKFPPYEGPDFNQRITNNPITYSDQSTISGLGESDLNKMFLVPEALSNQIPFQIQKRQNFQFSLSGPYLLYRQGFHSLLQLLKQVAKNSNNPVNAKTNSDNNNNNNNVEGSAIGIVGPSLCGKSTYIYLANLYAVEKGWLRISFDAQEFSHEKYGFIKQRTNIKNNLNNDNKPNETPAEIPKEKIIFDQALFTSAFLRELKESQGETLKKILLKGDYISSLVWEGRLHPEDPKVETFWKKIQVDSTAPKTLYDLADLASRDYTQSAEILPLFVWELNNVTEVPVLISIDNMNVWEGFSPYVFPNAPVVKSHIPSTQLAMVHHFIPFLTKGPKFGLSLWATTSTRKSLDQITYVDVSNVKKLSTSIFSELEAAVVLAHYVESGSLIIEKGKERSTAQQILATTGFVPGRIVKISSWL